MTYLLKMVVLLVMSVADVLTLASTGIVTFKDDIIIKDGGTIGSASDTDAITIADKW